MEAKREAMVVCGHGACLESLSSAGVQNRFPCHITVNQNACV